VQLQVRTMDGFVERAEREWPIRRTRWMRLYLDPGRLSLRTAPLGEEASVSYRALGEGVTFWGAPLEEETEVTGPLAARLFVSGQDTDVDLFLVVRVFDPQGEEVVFQGGLDPHTPVAQGWLRASQRRLDQDLSTAWRPYHRHDRIESLVPGETYQLEVEIWPTSIVMPAGYRLALSVRGRDYEHAGAGTGLATFANVMRGCGPFLHDDPEDRSPPAVGGEVTLHSGGGRDAYLLLPVVPDPTAPGLARRYVPS
ncbi:MAG: CocE/NonD family hydrolase C-terminal non-catalytic domain-containing protein, partial [Acidimicrobiales bacterium]